MEVNSWVIAGGAIVSAIATGFIAWYAVANHRLAREVKHAGENHQQETKEILRKMNEILTALVKSNYRIANIESQKEIKKELNKGKSAAQKFVSGGR